jgi:hypothetical protein
VNKDLFHIPNFDSEGGFTLLDLRKNHIKYIPQDILEKFVIIDIRLNEEFDCGDFEKKDKNIVYPLVLSDCGKDVKTTKSTTTSAVSKTTQKIMDPEKVTPDKERKSHWLFSTTQGYVMNMSTIWILNESSVDRDLHSQVTIKMDIYMGYAIIASVVIVILLVTVLYGKKILKICKRYRTDPPHEILEEEEETSFSLPSIPMESSPSHSFKQE